MKRTTWFILICLALLTCAYQRVPSSETVKASTGPPKPIDPKPAEAVFRFAVYADTREGHDLHREIVKGVMASRPSFTLQTGDLVSDSSVEEQWATFDNITRDMRQSFPYYPARGNHDNQGGDYYERFVPTTGVHREDFYYSFDEGQVHFLALDTADDPITEKVPQYKWLSADMKKAKDEGKFIVPFFHKAIFSVGAHAMQSDVWALRPVLHDLFRKYGVKLVFQGHDHLYYRTVRDGITYVVTGGGGAPLYRASHSELAISGDVTEVVHHFCVADVFVDRVKVTAYRIDRTVLDTFVVTMKAEDTGPTREGDRPHSAAGSGVGAHAGAAQPPGREGPVQRP